MTSTQPITGNDGNFTVTTANTILNQYTSLTADVNAGATVIPVASATALDSPIPQFGALAVGDELVVMQMQGALIDTTNTSSYGQLSSLNGAGRYEFVQVAAINSNNITITTGDCGGLKNSYKLAGKTQIIRVQNIENLTINSGASITAPAWNGTTGGVVVLHQGGSTTINGTINANAVGFRGGAIDGGGANLNITGFAGAVNSSGAEKGEGIAGDATTYNGSGGRFLRGAPANGGGGANGHTSGGGGGANEGATASYAGAGVMDTSVLGGTAAWPRDPENAVAGANASGGGRGGYTQSTVNLVATSVGPNDGTWGGDSRRTNGGRGGRPVQNDPAVQLFMGGGGGAGDGDSSPPENAGAGGIGGGIVILLSNTATGTGSITANGGAGGAAVNGQAAGGGGGGAGGTIVIEANTLSGISASANGGAGGGALDATVDAHGPGGGGGGGYIATSGGTITRAANGALGGLSASTALNTEFPSNGATKGGSGNATATVTGLSGCFGDLTLALTDSPDPASSATGITYTLTATNAGPNQVTGVTVTHTLQVADTSFVSATGSGWTCSFASPNVTCTRATIAGATSAPPITVTTNVTTQNAVTVNSSAEVRVSTAETNSTNNTASTSTTVAALNDPPVNTVPGPQATTEEAPTSFGVSIADPDAGGAAVQTQLSVTNGRLTLNTTLNLTFSVGDGTSDTTMTFQGTISAINTAMASITFAPNANFAGNAVFTIVTNDLGNTGTGGAQTDTDTVAISVAGVNDPPVNTVPGAQATTEDTPKAITGVSIADVDAGGNQVEIQLSANSGTLTIGTAGLTFIVGDGTNDTTMTARGTVAALNTALGSLTYTPPNNTSGTFSITVTTSDLGSSGAGGALIDSDNISIAVTSDNDPPNAVNDSRTVTEDSIGTLMNPLSNDSTAPDVGETLTITQITQPANGSAAIVSAGTNVTFTPNANFNGSTSFTYTISDGNGGLDTATISVTVSAVNDPPDAVNDARTVNEDSGATTITVLANDTIAPDSGETLTVINVSQPANGSVTIGGTGANVSFTPNANFNGVTTFTYTISDGNGGTDTASVSVTVNAVNDPPNAVDDSRTVAEDSAPTTINVLANDTIAPDVGETLSVVSTTQPAGGTVVIINGGNSVTFQPDLAFNGATSFTYTISDGNGGSDTATVSITVSGANDPPTASNDTATVAEDSGATAIDVVVNDSIEPDAGETLTVIAVTQPANGTAAINGSGANVTFTPAKDFFGSTSFAYTVSDGNGGTDTATVNVTVTEVNDAPLAKNDFLNVALDSGPTTLNVLANDTGEPDVGETLTIMSVSQPQAGGVVAIASGGTALTFDPDQGFDGLVSFTYTIGDGSGLNATASVTVGVGPDSDGDLLPDPYELEIGTSPTDADTDDDGLKDGSEPDHADDSDEDGLINALDADSDNDGLFDGTEAGIAVAGSGTVPANGNFIADADPLTTTDPTDVDSDDGGVIDGSEDANRNGKIDANETDPNDETDDDNVVDTDGDGLSDALEAALGLNQNDADTDDDGVRDGDEPNFADDLDSDNLINAKDPDSDNDGLQDGTELGVTTPDDDTNTGAGNFVADEDPGNTTSAIDADTDNGGVPDGEEDENHNGRVDDGERDPNDPEDDDNSVNQGDEDGDGVRDDRDNCPTAANPDQADTDGDDTGDVCDADANGGGLNDDLTAGGGGCSTSGGSAGALVILGFIVGLRRRRALLAVAAMLLVPRLAAAQDAGSRDELRNFSIERFQLASDRNGLLGVEWAESRGYLAFDVSVYLGYANDPLVVSNDSMRVGALVKERTTGGLVASISPAPWVSLALDMPVVFSQERDRDMNIGALTTLKAGSGSLRLIPKLTMLTQKRDGIGLAIVPAVLLPTQSSERDYLADDGATFAPELDVSRSIDKVRLAANMGYRLRPDSELLDLKVDDEIFLRVAAGYRLDAGPVPVGFDVMLSTAVAAKDPFGSSSTSPLEAMVGASFTVRRTAVFFAGAGLGLVDGFGTPDYRVVGGLRLGSADRLEVAGTRPEERPDETDTDGDGVMDWRDNCKDEPEDKDEFKDSDGCPELDNDSDTVPDATDKCRDEAGIVETNGCPAVDADVDGVMDHLDKCPDLAEDFDSFQDEDGCPEPDNDNDGLSDAQDICPIQNGPVDNGGCPDADRDADGVVDRFDNCPDEKGEQLNAGCTKKQLVAITTAKLATRDGVEFYRTAIAPKSFKLLDNIAAVLKAQPKLVIEVGVHTDNAGDDAANKTLTEKRADAVVAYLIKKGVDAQHLVAAGFGEEQPEGDNNTKEGRAQNRRVVFKVIGGMTPAPK